MRAIRKNDFFGVFWRLVCIFFGSMVYYMIVTKICVQSVFFVRDAATLFFINLCARFCFVASPSFWHSIFLAIYLCVFAFLIFVLHRPFWHSIFFIPYLCIFFVFKHYFIILFFCLFVFVFFLLIIILMLSI